jgi:hypothetical protein
MANVGAELEELYPGRIERPEITRDELNRLRRPTHRVVRCDFHRAKLLRRTYSDTVAE